MPYVCPLCKGDGVLSNNPTIGQEQTYAPKACRACNGVGIVWPPGGGTGTSTGAPYWPWPWWPNQGGYGTTITWSTP